MLRANDCVVGTISSMLDRTSSTFKNTLSPTQSMQPKGYCHPGYHVAIF